MRDPARVFPSLDEPDEVTTLRVWHCKYKTLEPIADLKRLEGLAIATFPDETLEPIGQLDSLRYLWLMHAPKVADLDPLGGLAVLEVLSIATLPSWDAGGRVMEVESLRPLAALPNLRHLELFGVRSSDGSLSALETSTTLESVRVSKYVPSEVDRFRNASGASDACAPEPWF